MSGDQDAGYRGWSGPGAAPTTLVLLRHGATAHTAEKRFSGGLASANPGLSPEGVRQVAAAATWLSPVRLSAVVTSPVRRALESAEILADLHGLPVSEDPGLAEMEFGRWDGLTFAEVSERYPTELTEWLDSLDVPAGGGESFVQVAERVRSARARLLATEGATIAVIAHVTPIKVLIADAVGAPLAALYRMELSTASISVISYYPIDNGEHRASLRLFNALPPEDGAVDDRPRW